MISGVVGAVLACSLFAIFVVEKSDVTASGDMMSNRVSLSTIKSNKSYYFEDAGGDPVLNVSSVPTKKAWKIWNDSPLREEMLAYFPDFERMKEYVRERVVGSSFKQELFDKIGHVQQEYMTGNLSDLDAKAVFIPVNSESDKRPNVNQMVETIIKEGHY